MADGAARKPYHEEFAEQIIAALENGTAPWLKPWKPGEYTAPFNPVSGTEYKGVNRVRLTMEGHADPRFLTLKQANSQGLHVRKGEKARPVVFWQFTQPEPVVDEKGQPVLDAEGHQVTRNLIMERPILRFASVFHASQIEGMPEWSPREVAWNPHERCEEILANSGATIHHDQRDRAYYSVQRDDIHLPAKGSFPTADRYYSTALHELGHWTGAPERLSREFGVRGGETYAREELRAEIASWMTGLELGIGHDPHQHEAYVASWVKALQDDPYEIVRACRDAEKIKEMVLGFGQALEKAQEQGDAMVREKGVTSGRGVEPAPAAAVAPAPAKTYLHVPYAEKDQAKQVGALWDRKEKCWFAPTGADMATLGRWLPEPGKGLEKPVPALSPEAEFAEVLRGVGFDLKGGMPVMDGEIHRVPVEGKPHEKDGAYCAHPDGRPAGWAQNHRTGERVEWVATGCRLSQEQLQAMRAEAAQKRERDAAERRQRQEQAAKRAFGIWKNAPGWAEPDHPYFQAKGVRGYGVKVGENGTLLIPGRDVDGHIHTLQVITAEGEKRFLSGSRKYGTHHVIDPERQMGNAPILVAEGYATAATVYVATKLPVAVAFDSGNLLPVAQALSAKYPDRPVLVLADDDHRQANNPGLRHGMMAAEVVGGLCVAPALNDEEKAKGLTDWNDLAAARGLEAVRKELAPVIEKCMAKRQTAVLER